MGRATVTASGAGIVGYGVGVDRPALLQQLAERLEEVSFGASESGRGERVGLYVLNAIACAFDGAARVDAVAAWELAREVGGVGGASVWLSGDRRAPLDAAFANSLCIHGSSRQDMHSISVTHPGTCVIPAVLALAEQLESSGLDVVRAIVAGYEASVQVGRLVCTPAFLARGWRAPSVFGVFGSAAGAASLLQLDSDQVINALALAGNTASGITAYKSSGTGEGGVANASAARCGLEAALLASRGVRAAPNLLEAPLGFLTAFAGGESRSEEWPYRDRYAIDEIYLKPFESCAYNMESIEAARRLTGTNTIDVSEIRKVTIRSYSRAKHYPGCDNKGPFEGRSACGISGQFTVASTLRHGDLTSLSYENIADPVIGALVPKIDIEVDPEAERLFPDVRMSTLVVEMNDGVVIEETVIDLESPSFASVADRFLKASSGVLPVGSGNVVVDSLRDLNEVSAVGRISNALCERDIDNRERTVS